MSDTSDIAMSEDPLSGPPDPLSDQALSMLDDCANALMDGRSLDSAASSIYGALLSIALDEIRRTRPPNNQRTSR